MNETENKITPITRNDIAFNRRHLYESDEVKIGKKTTLEIIIYRKVCTKVHCERRTKLLKLY